MTKGQVKAPALGSGAAGDDPARLRRVVGDLQAQCNMLQGKLQEAYGELRRRDVSMAVKRVELLFGVMDRERWFGREYVEACAEEVRAILEIPRGGEGECDGDGCGADAPEGVDAGVGGE